MKSIQLRIYESRANLSKYISEELNPEQKAKIDSYGDNSAANKISKDVFPEGKDGLAHVVEELGELLVLLLDHAQRLVLERLEDPA